MDPLTSKEAAAEHFAANGIAIECTNAKGETKTCENLAEAEAHFEAGEAAE